MQHLPAPPSVAALRTSADDGCTGSPARPLQGDWRAVAAAAWKPSQTTAQLPILAPVLHRRVTRRGMQRMRSGCWGSATAAGAAGEHAAAQPRLAAWRESLRLRIAMAVSSRGRLSTTSSTKEKEGCQCGGGVVCLCVGGGGHVSKRCSDGILCMRLADHATTQRRAPGHSPSPPRRAVFRRSSLKVQCSAARAKRQRGGGGGCAVPSRCVAGSALWGGSGSRQSGGWLSPQAPAPCL
jgi:hypothetical protein